MAETGHFVQGYWRAFDPWDGLVPIILLPQDTEDTHLPHTDTHTHRGSGDSLTFETVYLIKASITQRETQAVTDCSYRLYLDGMNTVML